MCDIDCIIFGVKNLLNDIKGKRVLEVGSEDINGSLRTVIEALTPKEYVGVDIRKGPGVDILCNVDSLVKTFGEEKFDVVIANELLEHVRDWKTAVSNIKRVCKGGGSILITTRSYGFKYHAFPYDFWRYEIEDIKRIFSDCEITSLERDTSAPGILLKTKKPKKFYEADLNNYELYSIVADKRIKELTSRDLKNIKFRYRTFKVKFRALLAKQFNRVFE